MTELKICLAIVFSVFILSMSVLGILQCIERWDEGGKEMVEGCALFGLPVAMIYFLLS